MALDVRIAQTTLENAIRDAILYALGLRLPAVASIAALRAFGTMGASSGTRHDDELIGIVPASTVTAAYRWNSVDARTDNGSTVIAPTDRPSADGRWNLWTSPLRMQPAVGANSMYLHEVATGPLVRVLLLDKSMTDEEINAIITGQVPSVVIEAGESDPEDTTPGHRWVTEFTFAVSVIAQNLRNRREAAQGSSVAGESTLGANAIDGLIWSVLAGTQLQSAVEGVMEVRPGPGRNWISELGQRRIIRTRTYTVKATVENPNAPNDAATASEVDTQADLVDLHEQAIFDPANYVALTLGTGAPSCSVAVGAGLTQQVAAGTAILAGATVTYAGESHAFPAQSDVYRDLLPNGTMQFVVVGREGPRPPMTATALRIGVATTDSTQVLSDRYIAATLGHYGPVVQRSLT